MKKACLIISTKRSPAYRIFSQKGFNCCLNDVEMVKKQILSIISDQSINEYDMNEFENSNAIKQLKDYLSN